MTITFKDEYGAVTKTVDQTYDVWNQWIKRSVDADGAGVGGAVDTYFAYESGQIAFQWEDADGDGGNDPAMTHRYTWAEGVDQFLADEQISTPGSAGNVLWGLGDHLGTLRDIVDLIASTVSVTNHRDYNSFGSLTSETNDAVDLIFGYTSRPFDEYSWLQNNLWRWLDAWLNQWLSEDPIGFAAFDSNLRRYVGNASTIYVDPSGLQSPAENLAQTAGAIGRTVPGANTNSSWSADRGQSMEPTRQAIGEAMEFVTEVPGVKQTKDLLKSGSGEDLIGNKLSEEERKRLRAGVFTSMCEYVLGAGFTNWVTRGPKPRLPKPPSQFSKPAATIPGPPVVNAIKPQPAPQGLNSKPGMRYQLGQNDQDWRGSGKTVEDALNDAFVKAGHPRSEFVPTRWGKDKYGKSQPVEWRHKSGAEVNIDWPHEKNGPDAPHVGWQSGGKRGAGGAKRGHTILDEVPCNR